MTPAELIRDIRNLGGQMVIDGNELALTAPQPLPADLLRKLRAHKAELIRYLTMEAANSDPTERRRLEVLAMLAQEPSLTRAFVTDDMAGAEFVIIAIGIRGVGTCELRIHKSKYDGLAVLDLIQEQH
jgi:hypothetical protein